MKSVTQIDLPFGFGDSPFGSHVKAFTVSLEQCVDEAVVCGGLGYILPDGCEELVRVDFAELSVFDVFDGNPFSSFGQPFLRG